jgi:hypothetical protein
MNSPGRGSRFPKTRSAHCSKKKIRKRKPVKAAVTGGVDPDLRNEQFENIEKVRAQYEAQGWPVLSVDTKKKEFLGSLYRDGKLYSQDGVPLKRFDHDFPHLAEGKVVPHGIYDLQLNKGFVTLGTSAETPAFVAESIALWWNYRGRHDYPDADQVLLLMDAGGANAARSIQFKHEMLKLAYWTNRPIWPQGPGIVLPPGKSIPDTLNSAFWALDLKGDFVVEASKVSEFDGTFAPKCASLVYNFPAKGERGPVKNPNTDKDFVRLACLRNSSSTPSLVRSSLAPKASSFSTPPTVTPRPSCSLSRSCRRRGRSRGFTPE